MKLTAIALIKILFLYFVFRFQTNINQNAKTQKRGVTKTYNILDSRKNMSFTLIKPRK